MRFAWLAMACGKLTAGGLLRFTGERFGTNGYFKLTFVR
jgi:hypothetical protein